MANAYQPDFDADQDREGFTYRRAKLGQQAKSEKLGASLYEIPPGQATFPYHAHSANEEMLIVLSGQPHLRTPDGWRELAEGRSSRFGSAKTARTSSRIEALNTPACWWSAR
jgi:uncharacterized cupin superfamily protein